MRIAIVSPMVVGYGKTPESYSSQQLNLALRWADAGHLVDILTLPGQGLGPASLHPHVTIHLCPGGIIGRMGLPVMYGVAGALRGRNHRFILASEHYQLSTALACMASRRVLVYQGQNTPGSSRTSRLLLRVMERTFGQITRKCSLGVVAKTSDAKRFIESHGFSRVTVIPCGYDEARFFPPEPYERQRCRAALRVAEDLLVMAYAGNLLPRRDVASAIHALAMLKQQRGGAHLLVAGDGPDRAALEQLSLNLGLSGEVSFLGTLPWKRLREVYWAADVFIFPSHYEIFGLVLLEAMACGALVISTPVGAATDILQDGRNGYLVPIGQPQAIANRVSQVIDSPVGAASLREESLRSVQEFTWRAIAQRIVDYAEALGA